MKKQRRPRRWTKRLSLWLDLATVAKERRRWYGKPLKFLVELYVWGLR